MLCQINYYHTISQQLALSLCYLVCIFAFSAEGSVATAHENDQWRCSPENRCLQEPAVLTPHYIRHLTPGARIMMILRNPTDR